MRTARVLLRIVVMIITTVTDTVMDTDMDTITADRTFISWSFHAIPSQCDDRYRAFDVCGICSRRFQ